MSMRQILKRIRRGKKIVSETKQQQATIMSLDEGQCNEMMKDLIIAFKIFDKDNNGLISKQELLEAMEAFGGNLSRNEIDEIFRKIDTDKSGDIDFTEFIQAIALQKKTQTIWKQTPPHMSSQSDTAADPKSLFNIFDKNSDGFISPDEIREVMLIVGEELTEDDITEMLKVADTDGDGRVSYSEFAKIIDTCRI
ncbi:hypothetical protein ACOME3_003004 [Neoechinorhynchus agilis]